MKRTLFACVLLLSGCASSQLTYNVLDIASSTSRLAKEQVLYNLAQFIDSEAAIPAQVVFGQGSVLTTNTLNATFTDPLSKTVAATNTLQKTMATATTTQATNSLVATDAGKSLAITGGNTATQSWGVDTIGDSDVLRRLYDLYRFAVSGDDSLAAEQALLNDYPLHYSITSANGIGPSSLAIDPNSIIGSNCVLCGKNSASASSSPPYPRVCESSNARSANLGPSSALTSYRVELKDLHRPPPGTSARSATASTTAAAGTTGQVCLTINQRLLPKVPGLGRWLLWEPQAGATKGSSRPAPKPDRDIFLGTYGHYALYVDGRQPDRFSEFVIFITAAAVSTPNPSSNGATTGSGAPKAPASTAIISSSH